MSTTDRNVVFPDHENGCPSRRVAIIGAGTMGHGIAQLFAQAGYSVSLTDSHADVLLSAKARIASNLGGFVEHGLISREQANAALQGIRLVATPEEAAAECQLITECTPELLPVKQSLFQQLEASAPADCILASNTSSLRLSDIATHVVRKSRVIITHYFNPPHVLPTVEVVGMATTNPKVIEKTLQLLRQAGKVPLLLHRETPGLVVNRVQVAIIREVLALLDAGVASAEEIDQAIRGSIGLRLAVMGPLATMDVGGLDVWYEVVGNLVTELNNSKEVPPKLAEKAEAGHLGMKSGQGFYEWTGTRRNGAEIVRWRDELLRQFTSLTHSLAAATSPVSDKGSIASTSLWS